MDIIAFVTNFLELKVYTKTGILICQMQLSSQLITMSCSLNSLLLILNGGKMSDKSFIVQTQIITINDYLQPLTITSNLILNMNEMIKWCG